MYELLNCMSEHLHNLTFGLAVAFILPAIGFAVGVVFSKFIGGWRDFNIRRWWTTFCLLLPFVFLGMMINRMAEDHFEGLRASWAIEPYMLVLMIVLTVLLGGAAVVTMIRLWRPSKS
jgi:hypothetical protein